MVDDEIFVGSSGGSQLGGDTLSAYDADGERDGALSFHNSVSNLLSNVLQANAVVDLGFASPDADADDEEEERLRTFCDIVAAVHNDVQTLLQLEVRMCI